MKQRSWIVMRPVCFFLFLIVVVLSLAALLITIWFNKVGKIEREVKLISHNTNQRLILGIQNASTLFSPNNASAINLARILSFSLDDNDFQFPNIESKVVPALFIACSTIPHLSQISYIGLNGLFFSYYKEGEELYALYSNSTFSSRHNAENYTWYMQPANLDTGKLYGETIKFPSPNLEKLIWFQEALNNTNGYSSLGTGWKNPLDVLLLNSVGLDGNAVLSLGFRMKPMIDFLVAEMAFYDGSLYLVTSDWNEVINGLPNTRAVLDGGQVLFESLSNDDGSLKTMGNISCQSYDGDDVMSVGGKKYVISCSPIEIAGLQFVYVFAMPHDEHSSLVHKNIRLSFLLLVLMVGAILVTVCIFVSLIVEAARREMFLCGALINQMESTQQAERKSMNKSLAFASASHDIRASLAGISGLIEICCNEVTKRDPAPSEVVKNLVLMEACTRDLLGILNCILDTSKIEAGKMQLNEEEFNVEQLLEDVVDLFHPIGMKKCVDVILDPSDGSVSTFSRVIGDRSKLKQILSNLLSNAVKFTSEGHVTVRAWASKPSLKNEVLSSSHSNSMSCLLCLLFKIHKANSESQGVDGVQRDPNCMEFTFEVNDTGKGIPKEKKKSVFENYVQVKETAHGQQGTGIGLGIVQSLVRLMKGEIWIMDKEVGERGTCFRFNVLLNRCESATTNDFVANPSLLIRNQTLKLERSRVILMVQSDKRSKVVEAFMQRLGIKVHVVKHYKQLTPTLNQMKKKLHVWNSNSEGNSRSDASSTRSVPLSSLDGVDEAHQKRPNGDSGFVLMVIDTRIGPFTELSDAVAQFRRDLNYNWCSRVLWLDMPDSNLNSFDMDKLAPPDLIISKPLHGSRLYQTIALLPEFGGIPPRRGQQMLTSDVCAENQIGGFESECTNSLKGKRILIVDDDIIGRRIAMSVASQLGAISFLCENGAKACEIVCKSLEGEHSGAASVDSVRFDCILMDCEMPEMDGSEATERIREAESSYGVHTPIIALTAHNKGQEIDHMIKAGVDGYITKPLNKDKFLNLISQFISYV